MKIIISIKDIDTLVKGDHYIIQPIGYDLQQPEKLSDYSKEIEDIQKAIEANFTTISDKIIKDAEYFADNYDSDSIKAVAKSINLKISGTALKIAALVLTKISAEEFEIAVINIK